MFIKSRSLRNAEDRIEALGEMVIDLEEERDDAAAEAARARSDVACLQARVEALQAAAETDRITVEALRAETARLRLERGLLEERRGRAAARWVTHALTTNSERGASAALRAQAIMALPATEFETPTVVCNHDAGEQPEWRVEQEPWGYRDDAVEHLQARYGLTEADAEEVLAEALAEEDSRRAALDYAV
ncbi:hypothetical protein [Nocardiopsis potens]|uniref:hypothetical protein n=1 Tax=Nocardiopsis potens TaxID=1246458 RepID=UPI000347DED6|nr:hypothetical protein [Nocardiopsis potens]